MSKINKVFASIQILIFLSLTLCGSGIPFNVSLKSGEYPGKGHTCGCKTEADCTAHCCCSPQGNSSKGGIQSFISSLRCKSGGVAIPFTNAELKYTLEDSSVITKIKFIGFLAGDIRVHLCEPAVSPPEKPPRYST